MEPPVVKKSDRAKSPQLRRHVLRDHLPWYSVRSTACWECQEQFGCTTFLKQHQAATSHSFFFHPQSFDTLVPVTDCFFFHFLKDSLGMEDLGSLLSFPIIQTSMSNVSSGDIGIEFTTLECHCMV